MKQPLPSDKQTTLPGFDVTDRLQQLELLEQKVLEASKLIVSLKDENTRLKKQIDQAEHKATTMQEKNSQARQQVQSIIDNLQSSSAKPTNGK